MGESHIFLRPTKEEYAIMERAKSVSGGVNGWAEVFEAAERVFVKSDISPSLLKSSIHVPETDSVPPASMRFRINDVALDKEVNEIIRKVWGISRIRASYKLRVVLTSYILSFESSVRPTTNAEPVIANDSSQKKLEAITLLLKANDSTVERVLEILTED